MIPWFVLTASEAGATSSVTRTFCAVYTVDYNDASTGDHLNGTTVIARGAKFRFHNRSTNVDTDVIASVGGATPGCVTVSLENSPGVTWDIRLLRYAEIEGNIVKVTNTAHAVGVTTLQSNYAPVAGNTLTYYPGVSAAINIMAAATWGLYSSSGSVTGATFELHPDASYNEYVATTHEINILDDDSKFAVLHELGHAIFDAANGFSGGTSRNFAAEADTCGPGYANNEHWMNSKEYQSAAAWEGVASFYAAFALNDHASPGAACDFRQWYRNDWDLDGFKLPPDPFEFSCEDGIVDLSIPEFDYLGEYCIGSGQVNNRATQYDWLRMFWDLATDHELTLAEIQALWVLAEPHNWSASGDGTGGSYPAARFAQAALESAIPDVEANWLSWAEEQGVHR